VYHFLTSHNFLILLESKAFFPWLKSAIGKKETSVSLDKSFINDLAGSILHISQSL
jgi:hypothetical protein